MRCAGKISEAIGSCRTLAWLLGALSVSVAVPAYAQTNPFAGRLHVHAPAECPSQAELSRQIVEQLSQQGLRDAVEFEFDVEIARLAERYRGRLRMLAPQPSSEARELDDADCAKLVRALALMVALLVGPQSAAPKSLEPPPPEPAVTPLPAPDTLPPPLPALPVSPAILTILPEPPAPAAHFHLLLAGAADEATATAPSATLEPRIGLSLEREPLRGALTTLGVSLRFAHTDTIRVATGDTELSWQIARTALCQGYRVGAFAAGPCLGLELGRLRASASRATDSVSKSEPWLAALAGVRGSLRPLPSARIFVEAGLLVPFVRPRFYFRRQGGSDPVYDVPALGVSVSVGAELLLF